MGRTGEDLDKDPHVEVYVAGEEWDNVALVAVGVGLQTGQDDSYTLRGALNGILSHWVWVQQ